MIPKPVLQHHTEKILSSWYQCLRHHLDLSVASVQVTQLDLPYFFCVLVNICYVSCIDHVIDYELANMVHVRNGLILCLLHRGIQLQANSFLNHLVLRPRRSTWAALR